MSGTTHDLIIFFNMQSIFKGFNWKDDFVFQRFEILCCFNKFIMLFHYKNWFEKPRVVVK
jgi:hypothetical protein